MKILVFGNPLVEKDNLALKLLPKLKILFPQIEFIEADSIEEIHKHGSHLNILDVAPGINKVETFNLKDDKDLDKLTTSKIFSMHDFDLGYNLKLLKKVKLIDSANIICLPLEMDVGEALESVGEKIKSIFPY